MSRFMLSTILHKLVLWVTIECRFTLSTLMGLIGLAMCLDFVCRVMLAAATGVLGDELCTWSP